MLLQSAESGLVNSSSLSADEGNLEDFMDGFNVDDESSLMATLAGSRKLNMTHVSSRILLLLPDYFYFVPSSSRLPYRMYFSSYSPAPTACIPTIATCIIRYLFSPQKAHTPNMLNIRYNHEVLQCSVFDNTK